MELVFGLTGPNASGKGEVAVYLASRGFSIHSLSDVVREEARSRGLPPERNHLIEVGNALRRQGGPGILAERILPKLHGLSVVDSIRNPAEVAALRGVGLFVLLGIRASVPVRYERSLTRGRAGDARTLAEFEALERKENAADPLAQQLGATFDLADRIVDNDGSLASLHGVLENLLRDYFFPGGTSP